MAEIYLEHPEHGKKVATLEDEAVADEKNGWVRIATPAEEPKPVLRRVRK